MSMQARSRRFQGSGYAVGHKLKSKQSGTQTCQRCAKTFSSRRLVPYCSPCFAEKRAERKVWASHPKDAL